MLGERLAPCWCYSSIHLDERKKASTPHALVGRSRRESVCVLQNISVIYLHWSKLCAVCVPRNISVIYLLLSKFRAHVTEIGF